MPSGLPTATTVSPTASALLSPMTAGVRPVASTLMTRHVGGGVLPDDGGVVGVAVVQLDLDAGGPVDDVGAGQDIAVLTDDDAGARAALHVVAAEPGLRAAHLFRRDGHNAGRHHRGDLRDAHPLAAGAAGVFGVGGRALHLLHHDLAAGQAGAAGDDGPGQAAAKAQHHNAQARQHPQQHAVLLFGFGGRLLRRAGVAVAVGAAAAAAETAGVAVVVGAAALRVVAAGVAGAGVGAAARLRRGGIIGARGVGGVHAAAAHVGVGVLLRCAALRRAASIRRAAAGVVCMVVKPGVIVFVAHAGPSFLWWVGGFLPFLPNSIPVNCEIGILCG